MSVLKAASPRATRYVDGSAEVLPMNRPSLIRPLSQRGSAVVITLLMIVVLTVLILTVTVQSQLERQLSSAHFAEQQAQNAAQMGFDAALTRIRETLAPFDDPFGSTNLPTNFWSLSPGRIDLFAFTANASGRPNRLAVVPLHSGYPVANTNDAANLNAPDSYGRKPIWRIVGNDGKDIGPKMEVDWIPVGKDPAQAVGTNNPIVARFAFWVDDEGSKINVNTADGSDNYSLSSYGQGTPTAVSLSVFEELGDTNAPDRETVRALAAEVRLRPLLVTADMSSRSLSLTHPVSGEVTEKSVSPKFPATNEFNLTTYSRSPDFNIFNLPKFQLIPSNVDSLSQLAGTNGFLAVNRMIQYPQVSSVYYYTYITGAQSSIRSLYPTPRQLTGNWTNVWPFMPTHPDVKELQIIASKKKMDDAGSSIFGSDTNLFNLATNRFEAMRQTALYLVGTNALNQPVSWPFRDANYLEKYKSLRQIDSIALQIFEMSRNAATRAGAGNDDKFINPSILPYGLLGDQPVGSAVGRYHRLTRVLAKVSLFARPGAAPKLDSATYYPLVQTDANNNPLNYPYDDGANFQMNLAFSTYLPRQLYAPDNVIDERIIDFGQWDSVWNTISNFGWSTQGGLNEMDGSKGANSTLTGSRWMDALMYAEADYGDGYISGTNSAGIDFRANASNAEDPDPRRMDMRRPEYKAITWTTGSGTNKVTNNVSGFRHWGTGYTTPHWSGSPLLTSYDTSPMLRIVAFGTSPRYAGLYPGLSQNYSQNTPGNGVGTPGGSLNRDFRTRNLHPNPNDMDLSIQSIRLRGGLTLQVREAARMALTPLDSILGPLDSTWSSYVLPKSATNVVANLAKAVVPIFKPEGMPVALGQTRYVVAKLRDPLVGQLPGDWQVNHYNTKAEAQAATTLGDVFRKDTDGASLENISWPYNGGDGNTNQFDTKWEREWVDMAADSGAVNLTAGDHDNTNNFIFRPYLEGDVQRIQRVGGSGRMVNLSRQLTFPSVGQLQYVRTGAMPDTRPDNTEPKLGDADYAGMPFRCLNFGPANTQGGIPDWAMLDLFTVPNAIWTKPSSRFAYPGLAVNQTNRPELIQLTYGGASTGKINLNGAVLWPWAEDDTNFVRPMPLAAQFNGLRYNHNGKVSRTYEKVSFGRSVVQVVTSTNSWEVLSAPQAYSLAEAIANYIRTHDPLAMPGQMCDIPAVSVLDGKPLGAAIRMAHPDTGESLLPGGHSTPFYGPGINNPESPVINRTRNDIVSQSVGNLTTQGNVFAVWVMGESIRKSPTTDPTQFVKGQDKVVATSRMKFIVERKLDPGVDGIYGNSAPGRAGLDGDVGTPDDRCDAGNAVDALYHPPNPKFIYQVLQMQQVQ